ncbi:MAG: c-type cytochrome [Opitutales bacterium]
MSQDPQKQSSDPRDLPQSTLERGRVGDEHIRQVHAQLMREKEEPTEGFSPTPIFLLFIFSALIFWGGIYLEKNSGQFRWDVYDPDFTGEVAQIEPPDYNSFEWLYGRGERIYTQQCQQCHQANGMGAPGAYPPLVGSQWVTGSAPRVSKILINGLVGPIEVNGNTYNGNMPAFGNVLRERDIAAVLTYIRNTWGNEAPAITPDEFAQYLADAGGRTAPWTADDLTAQYPLEE